MWFYQWRYRGEGPRSHRLGRHPLHPNVHDISRQVDKTPVFRVLQRAGTVQAAVIPDVSKAVLGFELCDRVAKGPRVYSDSQGGYSRLRADYDHQVVNHAERYVRYSGSSRMSAAETRERR